MAEAAATRTTIVRNRDQLDGLLLELEDRGYGEAAAFDGTTPYLLAACELAGESRWDAFTSHPYATENQPRGLEQPTGLEEELENEGRWDTDALRLYGISGEKQYPGLAGLRYPLTVLHPGLEGETPYLDERSTEVSIGLTTESPQEQISDADSLTMVAIPTGLLQRFQSEDQHFQEVFLSHTEPEELWTAAGELEPLQLEILELVSRASLQGTDPTTEAQ